MLNPHEIVPITLAGILLLLLAAGAALSIAPLPREIAVSDTDRIECWSLESGFQRQDGWQHAHRADKFADNPAREKKVEPLPDTVCDVLDPDGLSRRQLRAHFWWIRPGESL